MHTPTRVMLTYIHTSTRLMLCADAALNGRAAVLLPMKRLVGDWGTQR